MVKYINNKMNNIPELQIGDGRLKQRFEFKFNPTKIKEWWLNFKFNMNINW